MGDSRIENVIFVDQEPKSSDRPLLVKELRRAVSVFSGRAKIFTRSKPYPSLGLRKLAPNPNKRFNPRKAVHYVNRPHPRPPKEPQHEDSKPKRFPADKAARGHGEITIFPSICRPYSHYFAGCNPQPSGVTSRLRRLHQGTSPRQGCSLRAAAGLHAVQVSGRLGFTWLIKQRPKKKGRGFPRPSS